MQKIATRYGTLGTHGTDDLISRCLTKYGEWAQHELQFVADNLPAPSRVADIGAFLGTFGLGLSHLTTIDALCFVEANAITAKLLRDNVDRNVSVPSQIVQAVVGPFRGVQTGAHTAGNMGSFSVVHVDPLDCDRIKSQSVDGTTSLQMLTDQYGPFDLYKLDVEGAEKAIFTSERDFLRASRATFWVECNETTDSLDVADLLIESGFSVFYFAFPAIARTPFHDSETNDFPFAYEAGLWATRGNAPQLSDALHAAGCTLERVTDRDSLRSSLWRTPRWAPADWLDMKREEIVAVATHQLAGGTFDRFLTDRTPSAEIGRTGGAPLWAQLQLKVEGLQAREASLENELERQRASLRASGIVLFEERERSASAIGLLRKELEIRDLQIMNLRTSEREAPPVAPVLSTTLQLQEVEGQLTAVLSSSSWRLTMPLRMASRVLRGDWRTIRRMVSAKLRKA